MDEDLSYRISANDHEFWRSYQTFRIMISHLKGQAYLVKQIKAEKAIPEQTRDMAIKAMMSETVQNKKIFFDFMVNFISIAMQGLHKIDIEFSFILLEGKIIEEKRPVLNVEKWSEEVPLEITNAYLESSVFLDTPPQIERVLRFYKSEEKRFDRELGGSLDRCSLQVMEEIYPRKCYHIRMKLPAQTLVDHKITLPQNF